MSRFSRLTRVFAVALLCASATLSFAEPRVTEVTVEAQVVALEQKSAEMSGVLNAELAKIAALEQRLAEMKVALKSVGAQDEAKPNAEVVQVAKVETIVVTASKSEVAATQDVVLVERIILDKHTPSLVRYWSRKDTAFQHDNPWPQFWKEASRLSGIPHTDAAWRKIRAGTAISIPATSIFVAVQNGASPPTAIAVEDPKADSGLLTLNVNAPVVTAREKELAAEVAALKGELVNAQFNKLFNIFAIVLGTATLLALIVAFWVNNRKYWSSSPKKQSCCDTDLGSFEKIPPELGDLSKLEQPKTKD